MKTIAVIRGARGDEVQDLFEALVVRWRPSARVAGVLAEGHGLADRACSAGYLRSIATGARFAIFQDLGAGSQECHLEGGGALGAAEAVRRDIAAGCDLVLLSKFGKLEASGQGLRGAFAAAIEAHVPLLTSVSRPFEAAWNEFAEPLSEFLPAHPAAIDNWWRSVRPAPH